MNNTDTDLLADLIQAKHQSLVALCEMGRKQFERIEAGDMPGLLDLLSCKQRMLVDLQRLERSLDPFRSQPPESRRWRTEEQRQWCAEQLRQCEGLLVEIVRQEKQSEAVLVRRRDEAAARLQGTNQAGQARGAYVDGVFPWQSRISQLDLQSGT